MEEPRRRDVGVGVGGGGVRVQLWSAVVPRDRKSEESESLGSYRLAILCWEQTKVINNVSIT